VKRKSFNRERGKPARRRHARDYLTLHSPHAPDTSLRLAGACLPQTPGFRSFLDLRENVTPSFREPLPVIVLDHPKRRMMELDQSSAGFFAQPVLSVRHNRMRHHQRSSISISVGRLNARVPEVAVIVPEIAITVSRPARLDLHRKWMVWGKAHSAARAVLVASQTSHQGRLHVISSVMLSVKSSIFVAVTVVRIPPCIWIRFAAAHLRLGAFLHLIQLVPPEAFELSRHS